MTKIWLHEMATKGKEDWYGYWANMSYETALEQVRRDNREQRKGGHIVRFRIREVILSETVKEVK